MTARASKKSPGKAHREGLSLVELMDMFPTEEAATKWFEETIWGDERHCPKCGSLKTSHAKHKYMPYFCNGCRSYFSVRTNTPMANSKVPLRKWAIAIYLCLTGLKSVSSLKLHRDLKVSQPAAWFMLHRIREAWAGEDSEPFAGSTEGDETYFGGLEKNKHSAKKLRRGRGTVGKTAVVGLKDRETNQVRAKVVMETDAKTLQGFVTDNTEDGSTVYTDDAPVYVGLKGREHETVKHSVGEYVKGMAHTQGIEPLWSMLKRAHKGTFHKLSPKHLDRYVQEFAGKHNIRDLDTIVQMRDTVARLIGRRLLYRDLIAPNGLSNAGR